MLIQTLNHIFFAKTDRLTWLHFYLHTEMQNKGNIITKNKPLETTTHVIDDTKLALQNELKYQKTQTNFFGKRDNYH